MGCRPWPQRDEVQLAGPGIELAEFARGLRSEPDCSVRRGIDVVRARARRYGKGLHRHFGANWIAYCRH